MASVKFSELEQLSETERTKILSAIFDAAATSTNNVPVRKESEGIGEFLERVEVYFAENPNRDPTKERAF